MWWHKQEVTDSADGVLLIRSVCVFVSSQAAQAVVCVCNTAKSFGMHSSVLEDEDVVVFLVS